MFYIKNNTDGTYSVVSDEPEEYLVSGEGDMPECFDDALTLLNSHLALKGINKPLTLKSE